MKTIRTICITGGTCGGKTSLFEKLKEILPTYKNLKVIYIPESGTELMSNGIAPFEDNVGLMNFQILNLKNQLRREEIAKEAASYMNCDNVLIICDRSSLEQQVFIKKEEFIELLEKFSLTEEILRNSYDAVFHLVSAAIGAEYAYGMISNKHRIHTLPQAKEQELRAKSLWDEHSYLQVIDNSVSFADKIVWALNEIQLYIEEEFKELSF